MYKQGTMMVEDQVLIRHVFRRESDHFNSCLAYTKFCKITIRRV